MYRRLSAVGALLLCVATAGCNPLALPLLIGEWVHGILHPSPAAKALKGRKVLVLVFAPGSVLQHHPDIEYEVGSALITKMQDLFPKTRFTTADEIRRWQARHPDWRQRISPEVARQLGADLLFELDILSFRTREPGPSMMLQGTLEGEVRVVEVATGKRLWRLPPTRVRWPRLAHHAVGDIPEDRVKQRVIALFIEAFLFRFLEEFGR